MDHARHPALISVAAILSLIAALIHVWVMPEHFAEWWGYGLFFLVVALAQALFAVAILRVPSPTLVWLGILGNLAIIVLWLITRTIGIPVFGPHEGEVEEVGLIDVASKVVEALLVIDLAMLLRTMQPSQRTGAA
jgi:hypothetical protein